MADDPDLLAWLRTPAAYGLASDARVDVIETPGARVFLAGDVAVKVKRPVDLGFLNFSTLERRRALTEVEFALNRRTAPEYYLGVVEIRRDADGFHFGGGGEVVEVGLKMRRFDQEKLLSRVAERSGLSDALAEELGAETAAFHAAAPVLKTSGAASMRRHAAVNAGSLRDNPDVFAEGEAERLIAATDAAITAHEAALEVRAAAGWVRRVHGDLHLANIFLDDAGRPTLFDAIEFDDELATLDVMMDLAFLVMDMSHRGETRAANRALNVWLDRMARADASVFDGLAIWPLCLSGRAAVRAHVNARLSKAAADAAVRAKAAAEARAYMAEALAWLAPPAPRLLAVGGRSGTGKSTLAKALAPEIGAPPGAVILRTDEVRKRLFSVGPTEPLPKEAYGPESHAAVYDAAFADARAALGAAAAVVLDAAFLAPEERAAARALADELGAPFTGLWLDAPQEVLTARVAARRGDASDADADVVAMQFERDVGVMDWDVVDASGTPEEALAAVRAVVSRTTPAGS